MSSPSPGIAMVTGASAGIGAVYAERLARRGHDLILVARDAGRLEAAASQIRAATGRQVELLPADLGKSEGIAAVKRRLAEDERITVLVNNAGMAVAGSVLTADPARLEAMVQLNIVSAMHLAIAAGKAFQRRGAGTLMNISSVLALVPEQFNGVYSGTKAFLLNLTQSLAAELQGTGVRVQAVLPGATRTALWASAGLPVENLPAEMVMEAAEMVDAALAGLDAGELVTIPSLPDAADWARLEEARMALGPNLSRNKAADRFQVSAVA
ncbi:SDR family oxidoreductase [Acetobacteraceae bacterium H6797]|nr:SDR family oxidoreductase [Acetobacteraceae bacterium H6797]